jgi:hypothetical protein
MAKSAKKVKKKSKKQKINSIEVVIEDKGATSFAGLVLAELVGKRLSIWNQLEKELPAKLRGYNRTEVIKGAILGFLSDSRGVQLVEDIRQDKGLLSLCGIEDLPSVSNFREELKKLGGDEILLILNHILRISAKKGLQKVPVELLQIDHGFIPMFGDGTLLECKKNKEGVKNIPDKGDGLMWSNWYIGSALVGQHLCAKGEGEYTTIKDMVSKIVDEIVKPMGRTKEALVLMDSLHASNDSFTQLEELKLNYIVGANKLVAANKKMQQIPDSLWQEVPEEFKRADCIKEEVAISKVQCESWEKERFIVCKRYWKDGSLFPDYVAVFTNIEPNRLGLKSKHEIKYLLKIWSFYALKMGTENYFKDALIDLSGHQPPCQDLLRNRGYYALLALAHNIGRIIDLVGGSQKRCESKRKQKKFNFRLRISTLRRKIFALPALITVRSRKATVTIIGGGEKNLALFEEYRNAIRLC